MYVLHGVMGRAACSFWEHAVRLVLIEVLGMLISVEKAEIRYAFHVACVGPNHFLVRTVRQLGLRCHCIGVPQEPVLQHKFVWENTGLLDAKFGKTRFWFAFVAVWQKKHFLQ